MTTPFVPGLPGVRTPKSAVHKVVFRQVDWESGLAAPRIIDGANSRDWSNTGDLNVLAPGTLMGKISATGLYAPSVLGVTQGAYTSGGTSLTVTAAQAVEILRRVGNSGSLNAIGPPSAAGVVAVTAVTFSNVNTTTGVLTVTSLGVNKIAGTLLAPADGSQTPLTLIPDGYGVQVTDNDGTTNLSVPFAPFPIGGVLVASAIIAWPTDTSLQAWVEAALNAHGKFIFDYAY